MYIKLEINTYRQYSRYLFTFISRSRYTPENMLRNEQQNSYRLSPSEIFLCDATRQRIAELIQENIAGKIYNERSSAILTRDLSDKIKEAVKQMTSNGRYKVVTYVTLGQKKLSTVMAASQCIWNEEFDRRVEIKVDNGELFVMALVFVFYVE